MADVTRINEDGTVEVLSPDGVVRTLRLAVAVNGALRAIPYRDPTPSHDQDPGATVPGVWSVDQN